VTNSSYDSSCVDFILLIVHFRIIFSVLPV